MRVELGEVEAVLSTHPAVASAAVVARPDGTSGTRLTAHLVPDPHRAAPLLRLRRLEREGRLDGVTRHTLPNGMVVACANPSETDFLYREIYEGRSYLRHGITLPPGALVFDVGAHIGLFSLAVAQSCPGAVVHAFEPILALARLLELNAALHGVDLHTHPYALGERTGTATFTHYPGLSLMSGRFSDLAEDRAVVTAYLRDGLATAGLDGAGAQTDLDALLTERLSPKEVVCELRTVSDMIRATGVDRIDLLKIDAEKSELAVLGGIDDAHWPLIRQLVIEAHDADGRVARIGDRLTALDFHVTTEEDALVRGTGLVMVHATRPGTTGGAAPATAGELVPSGWPDPELFAEEIRRFADRHLPPHMVPSSVDVVDALPLSPNGKLDRSELPDPRLARPSTGSAGHLPPHEEALARLFADVLRLPDVAVDDDFFHLGGDSLLAIRLMNRVRALFATDLTVRALFEARTVAGLAAQLGRGGSPHPPDALLTLRQDGTEPSLFCVQPVPGLAWTHAELLRHIDGTRPVHVLQDTDLGAEEAAGGVDAVAARLLQLLRTVQPEGPYHLLGWSFGGLVAHAMATRLRADGRQVALLALLDAYPLHERSEPAGHTDRQLEFLTELGAAELLGPERTATTAAGLKHALRLARAHKPGVFDGDLVLFTARSAATPENPGAEWAPYVTGRTVVHELACPPAQLPHSGPMHTIGPILADLLTSRTSAGAARNGCGTDPDHLICVLRHHLRELQYRSDVIDGCLAATGLKMTTSRPQLQ